MNYEQPYGPSDFSFQIGGQQYLFTPAELMIGVGVILVIGLLILWWKCR